MDGEHWYLMGDLLEIHFLDRNNGKVLATILPNR
jgi:hypothetical protein